MSGLRVRAEQYLAMRRALGFKLTTQGRLLLGFVGYLEQQGATRITTQAALAWATATPHSADQVWWSRRLMVVRSFARHLQALDPATEVPPDDVLLHHYRRQVPHLYSPQELTGLLRAADRLAPTLRALTWRTLISLLAATGLRVGEACGLDRDDVDLQSGVLTVTDSKFGKSRQVPVHTTTIQGLRGYQQRRDELQPAPGTPGFFVSTRGTRLDAHNLSHTFAGLLAAAGIRGAPSRRRPRIHDLRHSFATATLLDWYRDGVDVQARLPLLSTYLGHADPKSTYWYLTGSPELLALAAGRLEHAFGGHQ